MRFYYLFCIVFLHISTRQLPVKMFRSEPKYQIFFFFRIHYIKHFFDNILKAKNLLKTPEKGKFLIFDLSKNSSTKVPPG